MTGFLLYYARTLEGTILPALNTIGMELATPNRKFKEKYERLLDYAATYPNAFIRHHENQMVFHIDSDAAHLVMPKVWSRILGYYHL